MSANQLLLQGPAQTVPTSDNLPPVETACRNCRRTSQSPSQAIKQQPSAMLTLARAGL